jgi:hypothetical protein
MKGLTHIELVALLVDLSVKDLSHRSPPVTRIHYSLKCKERAYTPRPHVAHSLT